MSETLSVVMPVFNEASHLPATIDALVDAVEGCGFDTDLVLVDDGSVDGSADAVATALANRLPLTVVKQPNRGRFEARRAGLDAARGTWVLLLDGRVRIETGALAFVRGRVTAGDTVWTSHVHVADRGNPFGVFWRLLAELAWRDYFDNPRTTSFGAADFDRFPKGTTCFLAPRELLIDAFDAFESGFADMRNANDDTPLIRWIAHRTPIHVSPSYASSYAPRTRLRPFVRHAFHRGVVFVDGHGRRESRHFRQVVIFYPASFIWTLAAFRRRSLVPVTVVGLGLAAGGFALFRRRSHFEAVSLAIATPVYAAAHAAGMWVGLTLLVRSFARRLSRGL